MYSIQYSILGIIMERRFLLSAISSKIYSSHVFVLSARHSELSPLTDVALTTFSIINRKLLQNSMFLDERLTV